MNMIFSAGYPRFVYGSTTIDLINSTSRISFEDELTEIKAITGELITFYQGTRALIKTTIHNIGSESPYILQLIQIMNQARRSNSPLTIYPHYTNAASRSYLCLVPPDFNPEWLAEVPAGQKIELNWKSKYYLDGVPPYDETSTATVLWLIHNGDCLVTHTGDKLEFFV